MNFDALVISVYRIATSVMTMTTAVIYLMNKTATALQLVSAFMTGLLFGSL